MPMLWSLRFSHQPFGRALLGWVVRRREDFGDAADPVLVHMKGRRCVDVGRIVEIDEFGFGVEAEYLYPSRQRFVSQFLFPSAIELFLVTACWITHRGSAELRDVHLSETVGFDGLVIEPGAIARFPLEAADHAEFGAAATGHVVATLLQLDRCGAVETALPSFFLCDLDEFLRSGVFGAFAAGMPFVVARAADFHLASLTFAKLPASVGTTAGIDVDMCGFDP